MTEGSDWSDKRTGALLTELKLVPSTSEAERLIKQRAWKWSSVCVEDPRREINLGKPGGFLCERGRRSLCGWH